MQSLEADFSPEEPMTKFAAAAAVIVAVFAVSPASAKMMACTSDNMSKSMTSGSMMMEGPQKMGMMKEMQMANMSMSKGDMRGACKSYMRAQRMGMMKSSM
jgi:hypothetical protein